MFIKMTVAVIKSLMLRLAGWGTFGEK